MHFSPDMFIDIIICLIVFCLLGIYFFKKGSGASKPQNDVPVPISRYICFNKFLYSLHIYFDIKF